MTIFDVNEPIVVLNGYEKQFGELMDLVNDKPITTDLGNAIKQHALKWAKEINPEEFHQFYDDRYGRNYIGKSPTGWEAIVMTWKKGVSSSIHGHPQYAGYTHVSGDIRLEVFEEQEGGLRKVLEHIIQPGDSFFAVSDKNDFKNHIHRLTGLTDARTLHIYSDDARRGFNYNPYKILE
ncbi:MAG: cysteine dioxygenase [Bacteroidales bacterium]|jgi:hypothetical protein|nr:cysteine dioxygenase [Bacteroidales bacterium]